ncbi:SNF2-relatedHelicase [Pseudomonas syringae pv. maculicola]|nr:SNF2-relatedHelicase [Pseudomonas syringae pv. maculicola]
MDSWQLFFCPLHKRHLKVFFEAGRCNADGQAEQGCARQEHEQRAYAERQSQVKAPWDDHQRQLWQMLMDKRALASDLIDPEAEESSKKALAEIL